MSKYAFTVIAAALVGAANAITKAIDSVEKPVEIPNGETTTDAPAEAPKRRGKAPATETQAEPAKPAGKTYEELRELIKPLVEEGKGDQVKKVIAKYAPDGGGLKELAGLAQNHAAFEKDVSALSY